jgi:uncharacterized delta-60 repeat protein
MPSYSGVWTLTAVYQAVGAGNWTNPSYWIATLSGSGYDYGQGIAVDSSGNVYVAGIITGNNFLLTKYNKFGAIQWQRKLGTCNDKGFGNILAIDSAGNSYVVGTITEASLNLILFKYDTSGTLQWQKKLTGASSENGYGVAVDSSGNVYVCGSTDSQGAGSNDALIVKYNSSGTVQWQRRLGGTGNDIAYSVAVDSSANVYIVGIAGTGGFGGSDVLVAKYNTSGTIQWQRRLGGATQDNGKSTAVVDSSGNIYLSADTNSSGAGSYDTLIAKYDTSGTLQWQRTFGSAGTDINFGIAVDSSGSAYVTGQSSSSLFIVKYDTSGTIQWQRSLSSSGDEAGYAIAVDSVGVMYVTGYTTVSDPSSEYDVLIVKLPADGSLTGTYGSFTYAVTTLTSATSSLSDATATLTEAAATLTEGTPTLTPSTPTLTSTVTRI